MSSGRSRAAGASGEDLSPFAPAVYFILGLLILVPLLDYLLNVWPVQPGELGWRYGAVGLLGQYLHTPLLGLMLLSLFAWRLKHLRTLRLVAVAGLVVSIVLVLALIGFSLDALQLRMGVDDDARQVFHIGVVRALAKLSTGAVAFGLLGLAGLRAARRLPRPGRAGAASGPNTLRPAPAGSEPPIDPA